MLRDVLGALAGIAVAVLTVMFFDWVSHLAFPPPPGLDVTDSEALTTYIAEVPLPALLIVLAGHLFGSFDGTFIAAMIATSRAGYFGLVVGVTMLVGTITNLIMIPHPEWFSAASVVGIVLAAWLAALLVNRLKQRENTR